MPENTLLTKTEITIQDYNNNKPVIFSNLTLNESLISVNTFSFCVRPANNDGTLNSIINFKKEVLGKEVRLSFKDSGDHINHKFKGVILEINSFLIDNHYYEFQLNGSGLFAKVNEIPESRSFYKKKLDAIIDAAFQNSGLKNSIDKSPKTTKAFHYTVQYNQTLFAFTASLATRFGEWMYYDGEKLRFGEKPDTDPVELTAPNDVTNLNIRAQATKTPRGLVGIDIFKSAVTEATTKEQAPDNPMIKAAGESGDKAMEDAYRNTFLPSGFNQDAINDKFKLEQQALYASSVFITGNTRNNNLSVGKIIKIKDARDTSGKSYILTRVQHGAMRDGGYSNSFTAVPLEVPVPPYTNPLLTPKATPQAAIITDNDDDAGLARVKVRFPWMADDEKSPWISVLAPHAGKDKGFRFLPERDDEVMVDFWDGNAETPFVNGAVYTEKNKPEIPESGNDVKLIGTRTGRRMVIDDKAGTMYLQDYNKEEKGNILRLTKTDSEVKTEMSSGTDNKNFSIVLVDGNRGIVVGVKKDGEQVLSVILDNEKKQINIKSKGNINITADGAISLNATEINMKAKNIAMKADEKLAMEGTLETNMKGTDISVNADAKLAMKGGEQTAVEGAMLDLKGSGIANLHGGLVKIN